MNFQTKNADTSISTCNIFIRTPIEKTNSETYREQERRAEKLAREMQNDPSYKDIDTADSGFGEEEMFSSVARPSPPVSNTQSHIAKSSSSPSSLVNNATNSNNSNNINLNNNNSSNNNDGFTMYSSRKSSRGSKSQDQPVGPRFRNRASTQDISNGSSHAPVSRSYSTGTSHRSYTSSNQRNNGMSGIFTIVFPHKHFTCNRSYVGISSKYPKLAIETHQNNF